MNSEVAVYGRTRYVFRVKGLPLYESGIADITSSLSEMKFFLLWYVFALPLNENRRVVT